MELGLIFRLLLKRTWILILLPSVAAVSAYLFTLGNTKQYTSTAQLATGFTVQNAINFGQEKFSFRESAIQFETMIQTMNSELVLSMLSYRLIIHDFTEPAFRKPEVGNEKESQEYSELVSLFEERLKSMKVLFTYNEEDTKLLDVLKMYGYANWMLKNNLVVQRVKNTDYVSIKYTSENPVLSAFVVNALSEEYIRYDASVRENISNESVSFFAKLVEEKKIVLDEKTTQLNDYKTSNSLFLGDNVNASQVSNYELLKQQKLDKIRGLRLSIANVNKWLSNFESNSSESKAVLNTKVLEIRKRLNDLNQIYVSNGSNDPDLLASINSLRDQLQIEMNKLAVASTGSNIGLGRDELIAKRNQYELELEIEEGSIASLNQSIATLRSSISGSISKEATIYALERELKTASDEYLQALDKYNTEKNKSLISSSLKLIIRGQPNGSPESSKVKMIIALAGVGCFSLCVFGILFVEFVDLRIKTLSRFESFTGLPILGAISTIKMNKLNLSSLFKEKTSKKEFEEFKHFLRKIRFEVERSEARVVLITSTKQGEGKTFVILSLAYSLSLLNKRILIIDTNFRNNSLTRLLMSIPSFQKMLEKKSTLQLLSHNETAPKNETAEPQTNEIISKTGDRNIDIIGCSPGIESPSEILAGRDFEGMLSHFKNTYDYIFMEGASLNEYSDTKELMTFADKVIVVSSANSSLKPIDRESIGYLKKLNGKLLGAILNKVESKD